MVQVGHKLLAILLPLLSQCWGRRCGPPCWLGSDYISFLLQGWSRRAQKAIVVCLFPLQSFPGLYRLEKTWGLAKREQGRRRGNYVPGSAARPA